MGEIKLKAYMAYPGESPLEAGCLLVFHETAGEAKKIGLDVFWGTEFGYLDMRAIRKPDFDEWCKSNIPHCVKTNDDLPKGAPMFYKDIEI